MAPVRRLCFIQPFLTEYRKDLYLQLAEYCPLDLVVSPIPSETGFGSSLLPRDSQVRCVVIPTLKPFGDRTGLLQWGVGKYIVRERPAAIIIFANPRYLSFWIVLLLGRILKIPTYAHGHGLFKKKLDITPIYRLMMSVLLRLVSSYICYAPVVRESFVKRRFASDKLRVAENSVLNRVPVRPEEKTGEEQGILFLGRLRKGTGLSSLVHVLDRVRLDTGGPLTLHIVGGGEEFESLQRLAIQHPWVIMHGEIYDPAEIRRISMECWAGCYPGNAGLSVIHMMSLSLPVITHDDIASHQGPEPSFVNSGVNGVLFDHTNPEESLLVTVRHLVGDRTLVRKMQHAAFRRYEELVNPSLAARIWKIVSDSGGRAAAATVKA